MAKCTQCGTRDRMIIDGQIVPVCKRCFRRMNHKSFWQLWSNEDKKLFFVASVLLIVLMAASAFFGAIGNAEDVMLGNLIDGVSYRVESSGHTVTVIMQCDTMDRAQDIKAHLLNRKWGK